MSALVVVSALLLVSPLASPEPCPEVLDGEFPGLLERFDAALDGGLPPGWTADDQGDWKVVDGALRGASPGGTTMILLGDPGLENVSLQADIRFEVPGTSAGRERGAVALLLRKSGSAAPGVLLRVRLDGRRRDSLELALWTSGGRRTFQTVRATGKFDAGQVHALRIESRGNWIFGHVDGTRVLRCRRGAEASPRGRVGFVVSGATVFIDNVRVRRMKPLDAEEGHRLRTRPLLVAHRGLSSRAPENTLVAYSKAIEVGAEMAECDVRLSADGVPVLLHDENLKRTTGVSKKVGELTAAELGALDAGSWKDPEFAGERIPTLVDALRHVNGKLRFVIEIKGPSMEKEVVEAIRVAGVDPIDLMIFSFDYDTVKTIAQIEPLLPTTWLLGDPPPDDASGREVMRRALRARLSALGLPKDRVDPSFLRLAHECGLAIFVWTVNDPADMRHLAAAGVDAIISDVPDVLLKLLAKLPVDLPPPSDSPASRPRREPPSASRKTSK